MKTAVIILLAGTILGLAPSIYDATFFLSRSRVFEQMSIGLPESTVIKILREENVTCGISIRTEHSCWFSDFWRDYAIRVDPDTRTVNGVNYYRRYRPTILHRLFDPKGSGDSNQSHSQEGLK
jgi:hypothetical protein